jgi:hypothetical protein
MSPARGLHGSEMLRKETDTSFRLLGGGSLRAAPLEVL